MTGSIPFDRSAEEYDRTRRLTPEAGDAVTRLLAAELHADGAFLEIGVGTGLIALPLHDAGLRLAGVDLSRLMLAKLVEKAGGTAPFPLVLGDATQLPFVDHAFGGAFARHVLHLIADWRAAVAELVRVVRPDGVVLLNIGVVGGAIHEVTEHLNAIVGRAAQRPGLQPEDAGELDEAMASLGARFRALEPVWQENAQTIDGYLDEVGARVQSWTWSVDPAELQAAVEETRAWASGRFGSLDRVLDPRYPIVFRAYDLAR